MRSMICRLSPRFLLSLFVLVAGAGMARTQTFDATNLHGPVDMAAKWLIQAGDDPAWSEPGFDDSKWTPFNTSTSIKNVFPTSHPDVVWYRLHVKVVPSETGLALAEWNTSSAFDIFVNGERLIHSGEVAPFVPYTQNGRLVKRIPDEQIDTGTLLIALRVHISKTDWGSTGPGILLHQSDSWTGVRAGRSCLAERDRPECYFLGCEVLGAWAGHRGAGPFRRAAPTEGVSLDFPSVRLWGGDIST